MYLPTAIGSKHNTVSTIDLTAPAVTRVHWPHTHTQKLKILTGRSHEIRTRCGAQESDATGWPPSPAINYCYCLFFFFFCDWYRCFLLGTISLHFGIVAPRVDDRHRYAARQLATCMVDSTKALKSLHATPPSLP
jgi:hypothetical protein